MPKPSPKLCKDCREVHAARGRLAPVHLVHPERGVVGLWDTHSRAACAKCFTVWRREINKTYAIVGRLTLSGLIVDVDAPDP